MKAVKVFSVVCAGWAVALLPSAHAQVIAVPDGLGGPRTAFDEPQTVDPGRLQLAPPEWVRTGGPIGGLGYDVRMVPGKPDEMFVTDAWAGVFKSTDAGNTWFPSNKGILAKKGATGQAVPVFSLTVDPKSGGKTVWVGTWRVRGIYKSTDGGQSWQLKVKGIKESHGITFRGFSVHPDDSQIVFAAAEITSFTWNKGKRVMGKSFDATMGVVYRTEDGGDSWQEVWRGDNMARYVLINPHDPQVMYLSTGIFDREAKNGSKTSPGGVGVWKSHDGGATWAPHNTQLGNLHVGSIAMHPHEPDVLLAATGCNPWHGGAGVYVSFNGANSWERGHYADGSVVQDVMTSVEFAPSAPHIAYAGSAAGVYRSEDGGRTWERRTPSQWYWGPPGIRAGWPIDFEIDPHDPDRIFANAYGGGNFLSLDGGQNWANASRGYTGAQIRSIVVDPVDGRRVYASGRSGVFFSANAGDDWEGLLRPPAVTLDWGVIVGDPNSSDHVLGASLWPGLTIFERKSVQGTWQATQPTHSKNPAGKRLGFRSMAFAPSDEKRVYAGTGGVEIFGQLATYLPGWGIYSSSDGGSSWSAANDALSEDAHVMDLAVHPDRPTWVYAATSNKGVIATSNGGKSWGFLNNGLPAKALVQCIALRPDMPAVMFAGLQNSGLYRSSNAGASWQPITSGLPANAQVTDIVVDPAHPHILYLSDRTSGVYRSEDGGKSWARMNGGLHNREVNVLGISRDGKLLYAGIEGAGVYRIELRH